MFNKKIEQKELLRYKNRYSSLKYTNLPVHLIDIIIMYDFDLSEYSNQYNIVKAFYKEFKKNPYWDLKGECIMKAMREFVIITKLSQIKSKISEEKFNNLSLGGKPFYGGRHLKNACYIYHPNTKTVLIIGSKNLENFMECYKETCINCNVSIIKRRTGALINSNNNETVQIKKDSNICKNCQEKKQKKQREEKEHDEKQIKETQSKHLYLEYLDNKKTIQNNTIYSHESPSCLFDGVYICKCIYCCKKISKKQFKYGQKCYECINHKS